MFNLKKEKEKKEYIKEYSKLCDTITYDMIHNKEIIVIYDEVIPDMYVSVPIKDNKYIDSVNFDIYNTRLKKVRVLFPNGVEQEYNISGSKKYSENNVLYTCSWEEPTISMEYNGMKDDISLMYLMGLGAKIFLIDYDLKGVDFSG